MEQSNARNPLVLVTGATGFVGRHLCQILLTRGYAVRGTYRNKLRCGAFPQIQWVELNDIGPDTDWMNALESVDYVVHLAALAHQIGQRGKERTEDLRRINAEGTRRLVETIAGCEYIRRFVFLSSIGVVGSSSVSQITDVTPCNPDTNYGMTKILAEQYIQDILKASVTDWCIIRSPLVYGPGNPGNMERLFKLIRMRFPLPFGSISNRRSFIFVGNLIDLIEKCLGYPKASRKIFLASDGEDMSTPELVRRLAQSLGYSVNFFPMPIRVLKLLGWLGDCVELLTGRSLGIDSYSVNRLITSLFVDMSSTQSVLNWHPPYSVDTALHLTFISEASRS